MTDWRNETFVRRNPKAVWRTFEREVAIIAPREGAIRTLNEVGARAWELADGRSFEAIVETLLTEFDVSRDELEADMRDFLQELRDRDLVLAE